MIKYSELYEKFIVIMPKEDNPKFCTISKFDTIEMARGYEDSQIRLRENEQLKNKKENNDFWWNK